MNDNEKFESIDLYIPISLNVLPHFCNRDLIYPSSLIGQIEQTKDTSDTLDGERYNKIILFEKRTVLNENDILLRINIAENRLEKIDDFFACDVILMKEISKVYVHEEMLEEYITLLGGLEADYNKPTTIKNAFKKREIKFSNPPIDAKLVGRIKNFDGLLGSHCWSKNIDIALFLGGSENRTESAIFPSKASLRLFHDLNPDMFESMMNDILLQKLKIFGKEEILPSKNTSRYILDSNSRTENEETRKIYSVLAKLSEGTLLARGDSDGLKMLFEFIKTELNILLSEETINIWENYVDGLDSLVKLVNTREIRKSGPLITLALISKFPSRSKVDTDSQVIKNELLGLRKIMSSKESGVMIPGISLIYGFYLGYSNVRDKDSVGSGSEGKVRNYMLLKCKKNHLMSMLFIQNAFNHVFEQNVKINSPWNKNQLKIQYEDFTIYDKGIKVKVDHIEKVGCFSVSVESQISFEEPNKKKSQKGNLPLYKESIESISVLTIDGKLDELLHSRDKFSSAQKYLIIALLTEIFNPEEIEVIFSSKHGLLLPSNVDELLKQICKSNLSQNKLEKINKYLELILSDV